MGVGRSEVPMELSAADVVAQVQKIQTVMEKVMQEGHHYGVIPGTDKPTLLKPGAEKLGLTFRLAPTFDIQPRDLPNGHREYGVVCTLTHIPTGNVMGQGVGCCSTMESKYRYRRGEPEDTGKLVPKTYWDLRKDNPAKAQMLLGGKDFVTHKIDGVWHICKKSEERIENPDLADQYNTVLKIAKKRAQVDATLTATAASDIFTQDLNDDEDTPTQASPKPEPKPESTKTPAEIENPITGVISEVIRKEGKKAAGGTWVRWGIKIGEEVFGTFDKKLAAFADIMRLQRTTVGLQWSEQNGFKTAESIVAVPDDDNLPEYDVPIDAVDEPGSRG